MLARRFLSAAIICLTRCVEMWWSAAIRQVGTPALAFSRMRALRLSLRLTTFPIVYDQSPAFIPIGGYCNTLPVRLRAFCEAGTAGYSAATGSASATSSSMVQP